MEKFERVQVIMLPIDKGIIIKRNITNELKFSSLNNPLLWTPQHLYIISDDEIKEGDLFIGDGASLKQCTLNNGGNINFKGGWYSGSSNCKKIIATTDTSLKWEFKGIQMSRMFELPQPSQQFIEKYIKSYNKGNIITEVLVEYEWKGKKYVDDQDTFGYDKQILRINPKDNTIIIKEVKDNWNREEVIALLKAKTELHTNSWLSSDMQWIEENL